MIRNCFVSREDFDEKEIGFAMILITDENGKYNRENIWCAHCYEYMESLISHHKFKKEKKI